LSNQHNLYIQQKSAKLFHRNKSLWNN